MIQIINMEGNVDFQQKLNQEEESKTSDIKESLVEDDIKYVKYKICENSFITEIALKKHNNTKHPVLVSQPAKVTSCDLKCGLCDDKFDNQKEFNHHLEEQLQEIKELELKHLMNGHESSSVTCVNLRLEMIYRSKTI